MDTCVEMLADPPPADKPKAPRHRQPKPRRRRPAKVPIISRSQIDARTYAYRVFTKIADDVTADLGGRDRLSAVEAMLIESYAGLAVQVDDYNTHVLLGEKIDTVAYCQTISTLVRVASRLGLACRAVPGMSQARRCPTSWLSDRVMDDRDRHAGAGHQAASARRWRVFRHPHQRSEGRCRPCLQGGATVFPFRHRY
jgi:hypothetical protein